MQENIVMEWNGMECDTMDGMGWDRIGWEEQMHIVSLPNLGYLTNGSPWDHPARTDARSPRTQYYLVICKWAQDHGSRNNLRILSVLWVPIWILVVISWEQSGGTLVLLLSKDPRIKKLNLERYTSYPSTYNGQSIHAMLSALLLAL